MNEEKIVATNKKARRDYFVLESYEAGIQLRGMEVKSLRESRTSLNDSFARVEKEEAFLYNLHIPPYSSISQREYDPVKARKLLLHKKEINKLGGRLSAKGLTLVPLKIYFKHGIAKIELALCKGKKLYDKRRQLRKKTAEREIKRVLKKR
ncbi:MAG: SsrA-binding protein SmpB [Candidatus Omnitrophota bacterium]|nr:SsrA-binding protein SmpB [Candidatus Omnitrophota bacterium]